MKATSILCFAEKLLIPYIKEQIYTIRKFCHGYKSITYVIEGTESDNRELSEYLKRNDVKVVFYDEVDSTQIVPHLKKAFMTLHSEDFVPLDCEAILLIVPTVMFFAHHTPEYFFRHENKPQIIAEDCNTVNHLQGSLQNIKNRLAPVNWLFDIESNLFFGTERLFVLHRSTFKSLRDFMLQKANADSFNEVFEAHVKANGSDLELLGAFAQHIETTLYNVKIMQNYPNDLNTFPIKKIYHLAPLSSGQFHSIVHSNFSVKDFNEAAYQRVLADTKKSH